jgi:hypothetical protein
MTQPWPKPALASTTAVTYSPSGPSALTVAGGREASAEASPSPTAFAYRSSSCTAPNSPTSPSIRLWPQIQRKRVFPRHQAHPCPGLTGNGPVPGLLVGRRTPKQLPWAGRVHQARFIANAKVTERSLKQTV